MTLVPCCGIFKTHSLAHTEKDSLYFSFTVQIEFPLEKNKVHSAAVLKVLITLHNLHQQTEFAQLPWKGRFSNIHFSSPLYGVIVHAGSKAEVQVQSSCEIIKTSRSSYEMDLSVRLFSQLVFLGLSMNFNTQTFLGFCLAGGHIKVCQH